MITGAFFPVLCGSAFKNKGVQPLLDAVVDYLPSPLDVPPIKGIDPASGERSRAQADDNEPLALLAFKIMDDPFVGTITFCRIYSGTLTSGTGVLNSTKESKERVGRMLLMHANNREDIKEAYAGDIVALAGLKEARTGDTLCDPQKPVILEKMEFPDPVIEIAIEPKTKADQEKLGVALAKLAAEDPSFRVSTDQESGQTILKGMGELHLDIKVDILKRTYKVDANIGAPQVAYRETITQAGHESTTRTRSRPAVRASSRASRSSSSRCEPGSGFVFENEVVGGSVPKEYIPGVEKGLKSVLGSGVLAGFPVVDFKATLIDGDYHEVDSSALAFEIAARAALPRSAAEGRSGAARADHEGRSRDAGRLYRLRHRRSQFAAAARSRARTCAATPRSINAMVPLANMFGYVNNLRSMSPGPRQLHDAVRPLRASAAGGRGRSQGEVRLIDAERRSDTIENGESRWPKRNSSATSRTATSARSVTSTTARRR